MNETYITLKSLDQWAKHKYNITILAHPEPGHSPEGIQAQSATHETEEGCDSKGGLTRTRADNLFTTFAFLVEAFANTSNKYGGKVPNHEAIAQHLQELATKSTIFPMSVPGSAPPSRTRSCTGCAFERPSGTRNSTRSHATRCRRSTRPSARMGLAPASCNHYLKLLRHALNLAVDWGLLDKNLVSGVKLYNEDNKIERYLNEDELKRLLKVLHTNKNRTVCQIVLFLLATGARFNEALSARWEYVDKEHRLRQISASESKSRRRAHVPLSVSAIPVLDQLDTAGKYEHLFINLKTGKPYTTIYKTWESIRAEAGLPRLRLHDLRHSPASYMAQAGVSLYVIQQVLGHSDPSVTQRYAHLSAETLLDAADRTSDVIQGAMPEPA